MNGTNRLLFRVLSHTAGKVELEMNMQSGQHSRILDRLEAVLKNGMNIGELQKEFPDDRGMLGAIRDVLALGEIIPGSVYADAYPGRGYVVKSSLNIRTS